MTQQLTETIWTYLACGLCSGRCDRGPDVSVGISLLNDVVGDVDTAAVQRRFPGNDHELPVHLLKHHWANRRSWTVCREKINSVKTKKSQNNESVMCDLPIPALLRGVRETSKNPLFYGIRVFRFVSGVISLLQR